VWQQLYRKSAVLYQLCHFSLKRLEDNWHSGLLSSTKHWLSGRRSPDYRGVTTAHKFGPFVLHCQDYFNVAADVVCYGKSPAGGPPVGVIAGPAWLLTDSEPHLPLRAGTASARGGVARSVGLMHRTRLFLDAVDARDYGAAHRYLYMCIYLYMYIYVYI